MKLPSVLSVLLVLVTGCGTPKVWHQPSKAPADAYRDLNDCKAQARAALDPHGMAGFMPLLGQPDLESFVRDCMRAKGYVPTAANTITNATAWPKP